jgi:hypothetical protein
MCSRFWRSRDDFLDCPFIRLLGYQANFADPEHGLYLFNHVAQECGSTISLGVGEFADLYDGPTYEKPMTGTKVWEGFCLDLHNLHKCHAPCSLVRYREVMLKIMERLSRDPELSKKAKAAK